MLVLTRKQNQAIIVNGDIEIKVLQVRGNRIRLGIVAPDHVSVRRSEIPPLPEVSATRAEEAGESGRPRDGDSGGPRQAQSADAPASADQPADETCGSSQPPAALPRGPQPRDSTRHGHYRDLGTRPSGSGQRARQ